jgi:UTP--glucose-1-phosphate uridylyltransferase
MPRPVRKVVFPVAGLGTRMLPATKALAKEMLPVVDKPVIQYALEEARAAGCEEFVFVTGRGKSLIEDHFDDAVELFQALVAKGREEELAGLRAMQPPPGAVTYTRQQQPLGLGHAVWCARHLVGGEPFAVVLVDDLILGEPPCLLEMAEAHGATGGNVIAVMEVPADQTARYGVLDPGEDDGRLVEIRALVEKPAPEVAPSRLAIVGRYVLLPEVFDHLGRHDKGAGGEIQLTDAIARMIGTSPTHGLRFSGRRYDCGDKLGYLEAILAAALDRTDLAEDVRKLLARYR